MKNRWTLHVEDFGSIKSADIDVAPMMLFVGQNNTGKSYLASLLWGILETGFDEQLPDSDKNKLVQTIFSNKETNIGKLSLENISCSNDTESWLPIYLPASRTGFMLSYKPLTAELMNRWGLDKQETTTFTRPIIHFLQKLIKAEMSSDTPFADIAESLEKQILRGKIVQNSQTQSFYYAPESNPTNLMPLHTTSSLVTELAPLIIFLKDRLSKFNLLVFEEPESHLHLEAQRILARHLVKLVNRGVPVWMTTHSDTMFQQFNNLLASNEKRIQKLKNLSYQDDELIKPEDIKAYQFNISEDGKTDVVPLEQTEDGLIAPTFNKTIIELSEEAIHLEKDSEDAD